MDIDERPGSAGRYGGGRQRLNPCPTNPRYNPEQNIESLHYTKQDKLTTPFKPQPHHIIAKNVLNTVKERIPQVLTKYHQYCPPNKELQRVDFNAARTSMESTNNSGCYHIDKEKTGRATRLRDTKNSRYPNKNDTHVVTNVDRYDVALLDELDKLRADVNDMIQIPDMDLSSIGGMRKYQDSTGLSPLFAKVLGLMKAFGNKKRGMNKASILNFGEAGIELDLRSKGIELSNENPMEMFHSGGLDALEEGVKTIESQGAVMVELMTKLMGKDPKECKWNNNKNIASWEPDLGGLVEVRPGNNDNSTTNNNVDGSTSTMEHNDVWDSFVSVIKEYINEPDVMLETISDLLEVDLVDLPSIEELSDDINTVIGQVQSSLDNIEEDDSPLWIITATVYVYYRLTGSDGNFINPLGKVEEGWNTDSINNPIHKTNGLKLIKESIEKLKAGDGQDEPNTVRYLFMDTNWIIFDGIDGAEKFIVKDMGFQPLGTSEGDGNNEGFELLHMKVFWYWNEHTEQFSFIFLHRPFSRAYNSRPPWHRWRFGNDEHDMQFDSAITLDFCIAFVQYVQDDKVSKITANRRADSIGASSIFKLYIERRFHADSQVGTDYAKHEAVQFDSGIDIDPLETTAFNIKYRNACERKTNGKARTRNYNIGDEILSAVFAAVHRGVNAREAIEDTADKILIIDLQSKRREYFKMLSCLTRVKVEHFQDKSTLFKHLLSYVINEHNNYLAANKEERLDETFNRHVSTLRRIAENMNNWEKVVGSDGEEKYVIRFPQNGNVESKRLYDYLYDLDPIINPRGRIGDEKDDIRREKLLELGWTWDKMERQQATLSSIFQNTGLTTAADEEEGSSSSDEETKNALAIVSKRPFDLPFGV